MKELFCDNFAGIIIDTFGSLREDENEKNIDIKEHCFICGNEKYVFRDDEEFIHLIERHLIENQTLEEDSLNI